MPDKKYKTPNGQVVDETQLRAKYGDRFDGLVSNGTFQTVEETIANESDLYKTPNGSIVSGSVLKGKYGDKFNSLLESNTFQEVKKKEPSIGSSTSGIGLNTPTQQSELNGKNTVEGDLNPVNAVGTITTPTGVSFFIDQSKIPAPLNTPDLISQTQKRINDGLSLPQDVQNISLGSGKKADAVNAYLNGDNKTGQSIDRIDAIDKNKGELTNAVDDFNKRFTDNSNDAGNFGGALTAKFGRPYDINEVLSNPDKASEFLQNYKTAVEQTLNKQESNIHAAAIADKPEQLNIDLNNLRESFKNNDRLLSNHITETTVYQDMKAGVAPDVSLKKLAARLDPIGYKNAQKALNTPIGFDSLSDTASFGEILGALKDEISGSQDKEETLNSVIGLADVQRNNALQKLAIDKLAIAHLNNDQDAMNDAKQMFSEYNTNVIKKYPALQLQQMASEISNDIANDSGNKEGSSVNGIIGAGEKIFGATLPDIYNRIKNKGWLDNPDTKDLANKLLSNPSYIADASYFGSAASSALQPFKDLGLSIADISGIRNQKDIISDKMKGEMFPKEFDNLSADAKIVRNVVNTTANLAGMVAIGAITGGFGRAAGIGLDALETSELTSDAITAERRAELVSKLGRTNNTIETLSNATSFGLPSVDANLKDSYNFIDNDAARATYAGIGAILNTIGGKLLDLPKLSAVPGLESTFSKVANGLTDKTLTEDAANELLSAGKKDYVDFMVKYGKNVTEGAATMAYFTGTNQILKSAFGDPNTKGEDIINNTGNAFLDGVLGMLVFGAIKPIQEFNVDKNSTFKNVLYNMALTPDATEDIFKLGKKSDEDFAQKMQILNTTRVAKNSLDAAMGERNIQLDPNQQAVFVSNKTVEAYIRKQAETAPDDKKADLYIKADKLREQSTATLDGLQFTATLEPLYDIYNAEKEYNQAVNNANNGNGSLEAIATAKAKVDEAVTRHQDTKANPINETDIEGTVTKPLVEIKPIYDNETAAVFNRTIPQLSEEEVNILQPTIDKVNNGENVNEKELSDAQDVLYTALDKNEGVSHLIEPLIQKLQDYGRATKTEISTVTEKIPIEGSFAAKSKQEIKPALEHATGSEASITSPDGKETNGQLKVKDGNYVLEDFSGGEPIVIGEKAITDRDLKLPNEDKVPNPIVLDNDGNVQSVTFETRDGNLVTIKDAEKSLDIAIQLQSEAIGKIPDAAFDKVYNEIQKEVPVEVLKNNSSLNTNQNENVKENNDNADTRNTGNNQQDNQTNVNAQAKGKNENVGTGNVDAKVLVEPFVGKGALTGMDADQSVKFIAEQAQNISPNGEDLSATADARPSLENTYGKEVVDAAVAAHPKESLLKEIVPPVNEPPVTEGNASNPNITGLRKSILNTEHVQPEIQAGIDNAVRGHEQVWNEVLAEAKSGNFKPVEFRNSILEQIESGKKIAATDTISFKLLYDRKNIQNDISILKDQLQKAHADGNTDLQADIAAQMDYQNSQLDLNRKAIRGVGKEGGRGISALQAITDLDDLQLIKWTDELKKMYGVENESSLPESVRKFVEDLDKKYTQKFDELNKHIEALRQEGANKKFAADKKEKSTSAKKTLSQSGKDIADKILKAKIKTDPNNLQANILGLPIAIYNTLIDGVAALVKGGATLADAIREALKDEKFKGISEQDLTNHLLGNIERQDIVDKIQESVGKDAVLNRDAVKPLRDLIRTYTKDENYKDLNSVLGAVKDDLKEVLPDITERQIRDAYSGYGVTPETKEEAQSTYQKLKIQSKKVSEFEDAAKKLIDLQKTPEKNIGQQEALTKKINSLFNDLKEYMQANGIPIQNLYEPTEQEKSVKALNIQLEKQISEKKQRIDNNDFSEKEVSPKDIYKDQTTLRLQNDLKKLNKQFQSRKAAFDFYNKGFISKLLQTGAHLKRSFVLSHITTIAKLGTALAENIVVNPLREGTGAIVYGTNRTIDWALQRAFDVKNPIYHDLILKANRHGVPSWAAESAAWQALGKGGNAWHDFVGEVKNGYSEIGLLYGKDMLPDAPKEYRDFWHNFNNVLEYPGRTHAAIKSIPKRTEFERSYVLRKEAALRQGLNVNDPVVHVGIATAAYDDATASILMKDNLVSRAWSNLIRKGWESDNLVAQGFAFAGTELMPIVKIPTNLVLEAGRYTIGGHGAALRIGFGVIADALNHGLQKVGAEKAGDFVAKAGLKKLTAEQADNILNNLKKGGLALGLTTLAAMIPGAIQVSPFYHKGLKNPNGLDEDEISIFGLHIPKIFQDHPLFLSMRVHATAEALYDKYRKQYKKESPVTSAWYATVGTIKGLANETPFLQNASSILNLLERPDSKQSTSFIGNFVKGTVEPGVLQDIAKFQDSDNWYDAFIGKENKRETKTTGDYLKSGIPGLREELPLKKKANANF